MDKPTEERLEALEKKVARLSDEVELERSLLSGLFLLTEECVISKTSYWQIEQIARQYRDKRLLLEDRHRDN